MVLSLGQMRCSSTENMIAVGLRRGLECSGRAMNSMALTTQLQPTTGWGYPSLAFQGLSSWGKIVGPGPGTPPDRELLSTSSTILFGM